MRKIKGEITIRILKSMAVYLVSAAAIPLSANEAVEETVIVASRIATPERETAVSVTVIDAAEIALLGYPDIGRMLDQQAGIAVTQDGGLGKTSTLRIRGEEGFRTRILLDGIDIADPASPQVSPRLEHLMSAGLGRIEVLRGPQGLLYGADAGGVLSMTSARPVRPVQGAVWAEGGSANFRNIGASFGGQWRTIEGTLSISDVDTDGFNATTADTRNPDRDGYSNTTTHATLSSDISDTLKVGATFHDISGANEYDGCFDPITFARINACRDTYDQSAWRLFTTLAGDRSQHTLSVSRNTIERDNFSAGSAVFSTEGVTEEASLIGSVNFWQASRLTYGVDYREQSFDDGSNNRDRRDRGGYLEISHRVGNAIHATLGVRHDNNDDFGDNTSWRATAVRSDYLGAARMTLRGSIGTGFRSPSPYEIAYNAGPFSFPPAGEAALVQEKSAGWEIATGIEWSGHSAELVYFEQTIDDEIFFDLAAFSGYLQRQGTSRSTGVEAIGELRLADGWQLRINGTWNDTETTDGDYRPYRPRVHGNASLRWQASTLSAALSARAARDAIDITGAEIDSYVVADLNIRYSVADNLELTARIENLGDARYEQIPGFSMQGRSGFAGIKYEW
ncbi:TonB-dependent receptor [Luminiphilus syltensis NOR5-1B]|uniref:TonB-dependent receptor n=1 Tax=Luminiphilus syltensis NOR5-1B TaxID=565045 RepID=B8KXK0_9GAMM|nr:TonB-dependent receptor [Luminiphilus syltensis]EED34393.1 TonB-dependent receptor [Luminiphilus syltensis NOR5-1B]